MSKTYDEMTDEEKVGAFLTRRVKDLAVYNVFDQECDLLDCPYCREVYVFFPYGIEREHCWKDECYEKWEADEEKRIADEKRKDEEEREKRELEQAELRARVEAKRERKDEERRERERMLDLEIKRRSETQPIREGKTHKRIGVVYLMESVGYYKIGITTDIAARIKQINKEVPVRVRVVHYFKSDYYREVEMYLHEKYWNQNAEREWFELEPEQVAEIKSIYDYGLDSLIPDLD